tara:strand:+ start:224 stop:364 length:141 start_codon:yes stop_codon:yes gene_type:complete
MPLELIDIVAPPKKMETVSNRDQWKKFVSRRFLGLKETFKLQESMF